MTSPVRRNTRWDKGFDRLLTPDANAAEIICGFACQPFDRAVRDMDRKWGLDRLPGLVPVDMAAKYGRAVAALNASIEAGDADATAQNAANCAKGLAAMDAAATAANAPLADPKVWQAEIDGFKFAIIRDDKQWPALKAMQPDLVFYTLREVGKALQAYGLTGEVVLEIKKQFPNAEVSKITKKTNVDWDELTGDAIPL